MLKLTKNESKNIKAGAAGGWIAAGIIAGITFLVGVFDGFSRSFKCR